MIPIRKGLDVPISGKPEQAVRDAPAPRHVALLGDDYVGMRPTIAVEPGARVKRGGLLFTDKKNPGVRFTSPAAGEVVAVHRGEKRRFLSVVVRVDDSGEEETFQRFAEGDLARLDRETVRDQLVASGLWTALRARPYSKIPAPDSVPRSIFVTAIDSRPLAPDPAVVLEGRHGDFLAGLRVLSRLTDGAVHLCRRPGAAVPGDDLEGISVHEFAGPHPAGLPGTHIHMIDPVGEERTVWHIGCQDVAAVGRLFLTGRFDPERVISLAGPVVKNPRLVRTCIGASVEDLLAGELPDSPVRAISGCVLSGRTAEGPEAFLGRYHLQVSAISDVRGRAFLSWLAPGLNRFSATGAYLSAFVARRREYDFTTAAQGDPRAIIPIGVYDKVMPLDLPVVALLKAIAVGDLERALAFGCLELDEEDLALCSFVCPGKNDYGPPLRDLLTRIEKEG